MADYTIAQLRQEREREQRLDFELSKLRAYAETAHPNDPNHEGVQGRIQNLERGLTKCRDRITELNGQTDRLRTLEEAAGRQGAREAGTDFGPGSAPAQRRDAAFNEVQNRLEELHRDADLSTEAVDRLDGVVRKDTVLGADTQYLAAVAQPEYGTAFAKITQFGDGALMRMSDAEREAVQQVYRADSMRAMAEGTLSAGGYALPITVDPTLNLLSSGAINPIRQLATVRTISTLELRLIGTDGVTAAYAAEGTEASDNSPTLAQPDLLVERAQAFVPFSFEIGMDWSSLQQDLMALFADAKDILEAQMFLTGGGHASSQPAGILGGVTGSLTTSQRVLTNGTASVATRDIYALRAAIPPRFIGKAQICTSPAILDTLWNLVPRASTTDNVLLPDREHVLEFPLHQWSTMATGLTTGNEIAIAGDFSKYVVVDRLGMSVELVPMLFGPNRRPTGQRGLFAFWRNTAAMIASADNTGLRYLQTA